MVIVTDEFILNCIQYEYRKANNFPRKAYKNICEMILSETIREEVSRVEPVYGPFIDIYPNDQINLLTRNEDDVKINAVPIELVEDLFEYFDKNTTNESFPRQENILESMKLTTVKMFAYTFIWTTFSRTVDAYRFTSVRVVTGYGKMEILLFDYTGHHFPHLKYVEHENGTWLWTDDSVKFIEGVTFDNLAASELIEITKVVMGKRIFEQLRFDIEAWKEDDPMEYHNRFFTRKIRKWFRDRLDAWPREGHVAVHVPSLAMKFYRNGTADDIPFELDFVMPNVLTSLELRTWYYGHSAERLQRRPTYLRGWDRTRHWAGIRNLDINDEGLYWYIPDLTHCHIVHMCAWWMRHAALIPLMFAVNPPLHELTIHSYMRFFQYYGPDHMIVYYPIMNSNNGIQMDLFNDHATFRIVPQQYHTFPQYMRHLVQFALILSAERHWIHP